MSKQTTQLLIAGAIALGIIWLLTRARSADQAPPPGGGGPPEELLP